MHNHRRAFLQAAGLGLLAFKVDGAEVRLTPQAAREQKIQYRVLTPAEVQIVEALGETLLPGAREAGIAHFIDQQLAADPADSLLMLRYLDVPPPYVDFYRPALAAFDAHAQTRFDKPIAQLTQEQLNTLVGEVARANPEGWRGPPSPFVYFVLRNDAVDVVYGTPEGFAKLGVPYMAHIMPPTKW